MGSVEKMSERVDATTKMQDTMATILAANEELGFSQRFQSRFCSKRYKVSYNLV